MSIDPGANSASHILSGQAHKSLNSVPISIDKFKLAGWDILEASGDEVLARPDSKIEMTSTAAAPGSQISVLKGETARLAEEIQTGIHASLEKRFEQKLQAELELVRRASRRQNWFVIAAAVFGSLVAGLMVARFL